MPPSAPTPPAVVERAYELLVWLDGHLVGLPAHTRAALGARALDSAVDVLDALLAAAYAPRTSEAHSAGLRTASQRIALLRYLLRALRERRHLSTEQHAHVAGLLDGIGRMVGGWRRAQ